jgi:uncharacterized protein Yka (UPF0111/DUF47 family)
MTNDRTYLRMMPNSDLIIAAAERYATDLELVLLERLEELLAVEEQLYDAKREIDELEHRVDSWMEQANTLAAQLEAK